MSDQDAPQDKSAREMLNDYREEQKKLLDEETTQGPWIQIQPMCRVLLEMPEEDALWLRNKLNQDDHMVDVVDEDQETHPIQIHIREILIIP